MLKRLAYGVCLTALAVTLGAAPARAGTEPFAAFPWQAPRANALTVPGGLLVAPAAHLSLRLRGNSDLLNATTIPTGGHDWQGRKSGDAVSAELTYVLPAQGRMIPYVGLRVTRQTAEGAERRVVSPESPSLSEYGVGARTGMTLITGARGQLHLGLALAFADPAPDLRDAAAGQPITRDAASIDVALLYSLGF